MGQVGYDYPCDGRKVSVCGSGLAKGTSLAVGVLTLSLFGCNQAAPRRFLSTYRKAVRSRDYTVIRECLDPELGTRSARLISAHKAYAESGKQLRDLVREKFGKTMERHFHDRMYDLFDRLFDQGLLWGRLEPRLRRQTIRFEAVSGGQRAFLGEMDTGILVTRGPAGWSLSFVGERDFEFESHARTLSVIYDELAAEFALTVLGIRQGTVTQENVAAILSGAEAPPGAEKKAPSSPTVEDSDYFFEKRAPSKP